MPASTAALRVARLSLRSEGPYIPDMPMQPSPSAETEGPVLPRDRCFIENLLARRQSPGCGTVLWVGDLKNARLGRRSQERATGARDRHRIVLQAGASVR